MKTNQNINKKSDSIGFSIEQLSKIGNHDKEFILEMLKKFIDVAQECSFNMQTHIKKNDWVKLKIAAHKNIPTYSIMGCDEITDFLRYIEQNAFKEENQEHIKEIVRSVCDKNTEVIFAVRKYIKLIGSENISLNTY